MEESRSPAPDDEIGPAERERDRDAPPSEEPEAAVPAEPDEDGWVPL
ncbi:hypothetical protein [Nonomuraea sp. NPDC005650]